MDPGTGPIAVFTGGASVAEKIFLELSKDQDHEESMIDGSQDLFHQHAARGGKTTSIHAIVDA